MVENGCPRRWRASAAPPGTNEDREITERQGRTTCNTRLGAATGWDGNRDRIVAAPDAAVAGVMGATTASSGSWDVTPQLEQWHAGHAGQAMCLSYIFDVGLALEYTVEP